MNSAPAPTRSSPAVAKAVTLAPRDVETLRGVLSASICTGHHGKPYADECHGWGERCGNDRLLSAWRALHPQLRKPRKVKR